MKRIVFYLMTTVMSVLLLLGCEKDTNDINNDTTPHYEYVDLGLSVKWATFNVGATKPEEYGDYYAWGETETKDDYSWSTYKWCNGSYYTQTKYNNDSDYGTVDNKTTLDLEDDVAHVKWCGNWRMPTKAEQDELLSNCTWTWTTINGINGNLVTSNIPGFTNRSIFLPAAATRIDTTLYDVGLQGAYWSSTLDAERPEHAYLISFFTYNTFNSTTVNDVSIGENLRHYGRSVRPISPSEEWLSHITMSLNCDTLTLVKDGCYGLNVNVKYDDKEYSYSNSGFIWHSDNPTVADVNDEGVVFAVSRGKAKITVTLGTTFSFHCIVNVIDESNIIPEYVDLGLSVKWATFNIGATRPEGYGGYYAWGEIEPKSNYHTNTYKWCNGSDNTLTKYCYNQKYGNDGYTDSFTTLNIEDDVANVKWGGNWRMPTKIEQDELRSNCTWNWTSLNGVKGYRITSNIPGYTDQSIFLPSAGNRSETYLMFAGTSGYYWSSTLSTKNPNYAHFIFTYPDNDPADDYYGNIRYLGYTVRAVHP